MENLIVNEFRALENGKRIKALVNNYKLSKKLRGKNGEFREIIPKEVWENAIKEAEDLKIYINHQPYVNIVSEAELRAEEDGVYLYATLNECADGVYEAIKNGELKEMSFGFRCIKDNWEDLQGFLKRTVQKMKLFECSLLDTEGAYFDTAIQTRALELPSLNNIDVKQKQLDLLKMM